MTDLITLTEILPPADNDAVEIGNLYRNGKASMADSVRYLVEAGRRLAGKKPELGHGHWLPWLKANEAELGFGEWTAQRLMGAASKYVASHGFDDAGALRISREIWGHNVRGTQGTGDNEWNTPGRYIELARAVLGELTSIPPRMPRHRQSLRPKNTSTPNRMASLAHGTAASGSIRPMRSRSSTISSTS
jgi:hypothetical protein